MGSPSAPGSGTMSSALAPTQRARRGVPVAWIEERVAADPHRLPGVLAAWRERGLLEESAGRLALTEAGFLLSDALFIDLL